MAQSRTRWVVAVTAILVVVGLRWIVVTASGFGPDDLIRFEQQSYGVNLPDWYGDTPLFLAWTRGDGQAFLTIGTSLEATRQLGWSAYRFGRVGYSATALLVVAGQKQLLPIGMFAVNLIAVGILGAMAGHFLPRWGPRALLLVVNPAVVAAAIFDTAEALGTLLAASILLSQSRGIGNIGGLVLGVTRPTYATAIVGASGFGPFIAAIGSAASMQVLALGVLGLEPPDLAVNLAWPLLGYFRVSSRVAKPQALLIAAVLVASMLTVHRGFRSGMPRAGRRLAWLATGLLGLSLGHAVLLDPINALRATGMIPLLWGLPESPTGERDVPLPS